MKHVIRAASVAASLLVVSSISASAQSQAGKAAPAPALDDPTIVAIFDVANTWDMETGMLAEKKGTTKEVRDFGKQLVGDHKMVRQQGRDLAAKLNVTPTPPKNFAMTADHEAAMKQLNGLSGKEFDKAFLQHEVAYHKAVLDAVSSTLMPALKNQEVKDLVNKVAPAFNAHMLAAQNLLDKQK